MNIYYLSPNPILSSENRKRLEIIGVCIFVRAKKAKEKEIIKKIKKADILLVSPTAVYKITKKLFNSLPNLRHLALLSSGYDWIDLEGAVKNKVSISCCIGANSESVAEHTWGLIFGLSKRIVEYDRDLHDDEKSDLKRYEGVELKGKTLGILGVGSVGSLVAKIGKGLGMTVLGYDKKIQKNWSFGQIVDDKSLFKRSDVISVHLPLNRETKDYLDKNRLSLVKKGVIIVNTAREQIVNKKAILQAINNGRIFGYGVDVDKIITNDRYLQHPNIIVNRHNAYNTKEAKQRMQNIAIKNIESFVNNKPINLIKT